MMVWVVDDNESGDREIFADKESAAEWVSEVDDDGATNITGFGGVAWREDEIHTINGESFFGDILDYRGRFIGSIWGQEVRE